MCSWSTGSLLFLVRNDVHYPIFRVVHQLQPTQLSLKMDDSVAAKALKETHWWLLLWYLALH